MKKIIYLILVSLFLFSFNFQDKPKFIQIIPLADLEKDIFFYLEKSLSEIFKFKILIKENQDIPQEAYNPQRRQFLAEKILEKFSISSEDTFLLLITDKDLYVEGLNFVFGKADLQKKICIVSTRRFAQEFYGLEKDRDLFLKRLLKTAVHEIGHLLGLGHCKNPYCVMHFSNSILDTDKKDFRFCDFCKVKIKEVLK